MTLTNTLKLEASSPSAGSRLQLRSNGILIGQGVADTDQLAWTDIQSTTPLLLWNPGKAGFRAGLSIGDWEVMSMGYTSAAFGYRTMASGGGSLALGGYSSAAGGYSIASGWQGFAAAWTSAAFGSNTHALGNMSASFGDSTVAMGDSTFAMGYFTGAEAYASLAIGRYNIGGGNHSAWIDTDPVFEIGNGRAAQNGETEPTLSNALTVYKNGDATFTGVVRVAPSGDVRMYIP